LEIPVGAKIEWQGKEYIMYESMEFTKNGTRSWDYQLKFYPPEYQLKHWKMRNPEDNRLQYTISVTPKLYIEHIVEALNKRDSGWRVGKVIDAPEQVVAFDHTFIWDSLIENADLFKTEMEIVGQTINFCKIEKNKDNPLPLAYGKGNGFVPGVGRKNTSDKVPFSTLFVQGGEQNINYSTYASRFLLLPKRQSVAYDGEKFDHEEGFNSSTSRIYESSADGLSITRQGVANNNNEDSLDLSSIYPNRLETILRVDVVDANKYWYDIVIDAPATLDYRNCQIAGETPTITFQSGMLGGKTFNLATNDNGVLICEQVKEGDKHIGWKLQIVPTEIDGLMMPGEQGYIPEERDTLRLFGITLPQEYICDNINRSGASWDLFREAAKYMYDNEDKKFTFNGTLQAKWVRDNYLNVMGYLVPGSYILFRDEQFDQEGVMVRVTAVSYPLNNPYEVELTISNEVEGKTAGSALRGLEQEKVKIPAREQDIIQYTQRGFRDVKETTNMLAQAIQGYDEGIKPIFVQTMQTIVGDEKLQYEFTDSSYANVVASIINYNEQKQIVMPQQYIRHRTLGITTIAPTHDYLHWRISSYTSAILSDVDKAYYLYVKASKDTTGATMYLSEEPMQDTSSYYYLLFAIINKENNGTRSIVTLNSYTEILPGRITTDKIVSADGQTYFDLNKNEIGGTINFKDGLISGDIEAKKKIWTPASGISGDENDNISIWGGGSYEQAKAYLEKIAQNPDYKPTEEEYRDFANFIVSRDGKLFMKGFIVASDGIFRGTIEATDGVIKNIYSPNHNFEINEDGNVSIIGDITSSTERKKIKISSNDNSLSLIKDEEVVAKLKIEEFDGSEQGALELKHELSQHLYESFLSASNLDLRHINDSNNIIGRAHLDTNRLSFKHLNGGADIGIILSGKNLRYSFQIMSNMFLSRDEANKGELFLSDAGVLCIKKDDSYYE
jgi:hypothetical protein